jgi:nucleoside triphosphatase
VVPGGHVELGERIEEAAVREAKEETGLDIYDLEFINFQQFIYDPAFWKKRHFIFFDYAAKTDSTDVALNDEAQEYIWITPKEALGLELDVYTRVSIETYLKKNGQKGIL